MDGITIDRYIIWFITFVDQPPLHTVNSKVETDDHDPQEEEEERELTEEEERELTEEEKDGLMKLLDAMSSQIKPFL